MRLTLELDWADEERLPAYGPQENHEGVTLEPGRPGVRGVSWATVVVSATGADSAEAGPKLWAWLLTEYAQDEDDASELAGLAREDPEARPRLWPESVADLHQIELRASDDMVKTDLEVTCTRCGAVVCDAEAGDTLAVLVRTAQAHTCNPGPDEGCPWCAETAAEMRAAAGVASFDAALEAHVEDCPAYLAEQDPDTTAQPTQQKEGTANE